MRQVLSPDQMRALEARYFAGGSPSYRLMERAASALVDVLEARLGKCEGHCAYFACGPGNNGGDGYAAARLFAGRGGRAGVISLSSEEMLTGDARENCLRAHRTPRVYFRAADELDALETPDIWVDAMFGIGLSRPLSGLYREMAQRMARDRTAGARVAAVDIASGLSGQTGLVLGDSAVQADFTVTFEREKLGHMLGEGPEYTGELIVRSIGLPSLLVPADASLLVEARDLEGRFPPRRRNSYKNMYGHLLLIAGSRGMAGAAILSARSALRAGAGLVSVAAPESIVPMIQSCAPCAMCLPLPEREGAVAPEAAPLIAQALEGKQAVAIGPGLSNRCAPEAVRAALESQAGAVIDADALNIVAREPSLFKLLCERHLLTPHPGEAARLLGRPVDDPVRDARELRQRTGAHVLLKGATTVIASGKTYLSTSGTPGMATGGSGDVLTGLCAALLAQGRTPDEALWLGSQIHGMAGERAANALGEICMNAGDIIAYFPEVFALAR